MADEDPISRYGAMKASGATSADVAAVALRDGVGLLQRIRVLRALFGLSMDDARQVARAAEGLGDEWADVVDAGGVVKVLETESGYCNCGGGDTIAVLRAFLRAARERTDLAGDSEAFARASQELEACLPLASAPAFASWFVYGLEQRDLISHGFRLTDVLIAPKGRRLLQLMERFLPEDQD